MSNAAKALILTWIMIGLLVAGGIGFYLGRTIAPKIQQKQPSEMQNQNGLRNNRQPLGDQQNLQGRPEQQQDPNRGAPAPSGAKQNEPVSPGGGQNGQPLPKQ